MKKLSVFIIFAALSLLSYSQEYSFRKSNKLNAVKINPFSPFLGFTQFTYERYLFNNYTIEGGLGLIGLGNNASGFHQRGVNLRGGVKMIFWHNKYKLLRGFYIKPELFFANYTKDVLVYGTQIGVGYTPQGETYIYYYNDDYTKNHNFKTISAILNVGYQFLFGNIVTLDINFGLGANYCISPIKQSNWFNFDQGYMYGIFTDDEKRYGGAVSSSLKLGIAF
ncbi:MAG: hypothetical protein H6Q16_1979 [Bacteroidetes bacterium]|nr:hypothetical protein [Bacteroidota bacterium]